jgi:hypothetical protein
MCRVGGREQGFESDSSKPSCGEMGDRKRVLQFEKRDEGQAVPETEK